MNGVVRARIDQDIQDTAAAVLADIGLTVSDVLRMVLTRIAKEKMIPTELFRPNATTVAAMEDARQITRSRTSRFKTPKDLVDAIGAENEEAD